MKPLNKATSSGSNDIRELNHRILSEYLMRKGMRPSAERTLLLDLACSFAGAFSVRKLHEAAEAGGTHLASATVYNTVNLLCDCGIVRPMLGKSGERVYEMSGKSTMSYTCRQCGKSKAIRDAKVETFLAGHHFRGIATDFFTLSITGICPQCARALKKIAQQENKNTKTNQ